MTSFCHCEEGSYYTITDEALSEVEGLQLHFVQLQDDEATLENDLI